MSEVLLIKPETSLADAERIVFGRQATIVSIVWSQPLLEYTCRLRCRRTGGLAFGAGSTLAAALQDAFDELVAVVGAGRTRGRPKRYDPENEP